MPAKYATLGDRIIANSLMSETLAHNGTPCWIWTGKVKRNRSGMLYGAMTFRYKSGPRKGKVYNMAAHRASIKAFKQGKRITPKTVVMHLCNNSLCVNPAHLLGGTASKNMKQCVKDGRHKTPFRDPEMRIAL
jgi:hypothetical protein